MTLMKMMMMMRQDPHSSRQQHSLRLLTLQWHSLEWHLCPHQGYHLGATQVSQIISINYFKLALIIKIGKCMFTMIMPE